MSRTKLFNIEVDSLTFQDALDRACELIEQKEPSYILTPNVDHIVKLEHDSGLKRAYEQAALVLVDGMPLVWASRALGREVPEKISGSDFFPALCERCSHRGYTVFLFGSAPGVGEKAAQVLEARYRGLRVAGTFSPPLGFENDPVQLEEAINVVRSAAPDVLAVALGCPKQEMFILEHLGELNVPLSLGLGATLDFLAGSVRRAPVWMQKRGLEWLYRLLQDPKRLAKRYLVDDIRFLPLLIKELYRGR